MKVSRSEKLFILICIASAGAVFFKYKKDEGKAPSPAKPPPTSFATEAAPEVIIHHDDQVDKQKRTLREQQLKKCGDFLSEASAENLEATVAKIKQMYKITESLMLTEYQLLSNQNEQIVVQSIPTESLANQIRVLKTAADGFPDRIKDFPNASAAIENRLAGALQLGSLQKKIDKFQGYGAGGIKLLLEKSDGRIQKLNFIQGRSQLICEDLICNCQAN